MNLLFRNFWNTLRRYKVASILNILGLSIAFSAFVIIMMQVRYDLSYDKFHSNHDRIFRIELKHGETEYFNTVSYPIIQLLETSFPEIKSIGAIYTSGGDTSYKPDIPGDDFPFTISRREVTPGLFETFDFNWISGNARQFTTPNTVVIPQSFAEQAFPDNNAVGQHLIRKGADSVLLQVIGVYRDFPQNSTLKNNVYYNRILNDSSDQIWGHGMYQAFLLIGDPDKNEELAAQIGQAVGKHQSGFNDNPIFRLSNVHDIHFSTDIRWDDVEKINKSRTYLFLLIAILIVGIAAINFINFSTSLVPARLKSVNTQKVLGCTEIQIRTSMIGEAIGICLIAAVISVWLVYSASKTGIAGLMVTEIGWGTNLPLLFALFGVALLTGVLAGIYPAFYITSFPTALVLKGSFGLSPKGKSLRQILISFQYVISLTLVIVALFIHIQNNYMKKMPMGFERENLLQTQIPRSISKRADMFRERLLQNPNIRHVAFSNAMLTQENISRMGTGFRDGSIQYDYRSVSTGYAATIGLKITEGRDFIPSDALGSEGNMLFNETARKEYDLKTGDQIGDAEIVGFFSDFNYRPAHTGIEPMALQIRTEDSRYNFQYAYYLVDGTDSRKTIEYIENVIQEMEPGYLYTRMAFVDERIAELYEKEDKLATLVTLFSLLAIVISLIGVFGLVLFETQYRRKEIGLRRINGATIPEILRMLNTGFVRIVLICFVTAAPIAFYAMTKWLEGFAYKSPIYWWIFAIALLAVLLITLLTVTLQSYRAATENPVNSIKTE